MSSLSFDLSAVQTLIEKTGQLAEPLKAFLKTAQTQLVEAFEQHSQKPSNTP